MSREISLASESETRELGATLAKCLAPGDVVALHGGLGVGKTSLARGLVQALLGAETEVPSPTYTLVQVYETAPYILWHFDLYRLESPDNVFELGWDETQDGVALIEWPDKAGVHLPKTRLDIVIEIDGSGRIARLEPHGEYWQSKLNDI
ncbi:MAG: tRNA (adenosine(37)-N6)-threonylcarbamoyltransferase complex ATPase subunit type 1 TsaE [Hyphomonas sp.]